MAFESQPVAADSGSKSPPPPSHTLKRELNAWSLVALGVSSTIGAGIFVITGMAAAHQAGPAVALSYVIAGVACLCTGLCYAELAAMSPEAGSAYTYAYASFGKLVAWIIGWDLILEFLFQAASAAVGWSGFLTAMLQQWGLHLPLCLADAPLELTSSHQLRLTGACFNLPAVTLIVAQSALLYVGVRESATVLKVVVGLLLAVILTIIIAGLFHVDPQNWHPFVPPNSGRLGVFGWSGVMRAAAVVFFSYTGFEAISTATREARNPGRDLPIGLLGCLAICGVLYLLTALVMTGLVHYEKLGGKSAIVTALQAGGPALAWLVPTATIGIVIGLAAGAMGIMYAQIRIFYAMASDGLLPRQFAIVHPCHRTPQWGTLVVGAACALIAGVLPLEVLGELVSIGTLLAFSIVCLCVLVLRFRAPGRPRPFRAPAVAAVAPLGILICVYLMVNLPLDTWLRLIVWMAVGFGIYAAYGRQAARRNAER